MYIQKYVILLTPVFSYSLVVAKCIPAAGQGQSKGDAQVASSWNGTRLAHHRLRQWGATGI